MSRIEHLERPFPSSPKHPPKYIIRITQGKSFNSEAFVALYAAQTFVLAVINEREYKWLDENTVAVGNLEVKCEQGLEDIMEHKLTATEREWELPEPYASRALYFATGETYTPTLPQVTKKKRVEDTGDPTTLADVKAQRASNRAVGLKRQDREGLTTIQDICATLKIEPRIARGVLRKKNTPKPGVGWAWSEKEAKAIEAMIKKELK